MRFFNTPSHRGFTFAELLVVVAIIGLLSSIVFASFSSVRKQSRDKQRVSDLQQIQLALRMYKDVNGRYPEHGCYSTGPGCWAGTTYVTAGCTDAVGCQNFIEDLESYFPNGLPQDPNATGNRGYIYHTNAAGTDYALLAYNSVESKFISSQDDQYARYPTGCTIAGTIPAWERTYAVYSTGGKCW